jgi:O-antigen/teichoic acid export membrane protein
MAVSTVIQVVVSLFSDIGLRQAIIHSKNGQSEKFLNTAWTIQVLRGAWIWVVCVLLAAAMYIADGKGWLPPNSVYGNSLLPAIIAATSFSSVILGFQSIKLITMSRQLDLRRNTIIELVQMVAGLSVAIVLAFITRSIWSFVASGLTGSIVTAWLSHSWLPGPSARFAWNRTALDELLRFGRWIFFSSIIGVLAMNGDRLLLGGWVTAAVLGYYSIAAGLCSVVDGIAMRVFSNVSLPALGEITRDQPHRFSELYSRMRWGADTAYVAVAGFLFATGQEIVAVLYDARYLPAGQMLQWLSFGLFFSRYGLAQSAYVALGRPNYILAINVTKLISLFGLVPVMFYLFGIKGAILGIAFYLLPTVPLIFWFNQRLALNNLRLEASVLAIWPLGWLVGEAWLKVVAFW